MLYFVCNFADFKILLSFDVFLFFFFNTVQRCDQFGILHYKCCGIHNNNNNK